MRTRTHFWLAVALTIGTSATIFADTAWSQQVQRQDLTTDTAEGAKRDGSNATDAGAEKKAVINESYKSELAKLKELAAGSMDGCVHATYIAARDARVQAVLIRKLLNSDYVFKGVRCLDDPGIPEQERVLFDFDCKPGVFCLVDPNVLVVVDLIDGRVIEIIDPFFGNALRHSTRMQGPNTFRKGGRAATQQITVTTSGLTFRINGGTTSNPDITVSQGDTVEVTYDGTSSHDWTLEYFEGGTAHTYQATNTDRSVTFIAERAGTFEYYCSKSDHRQRGMHGNLVVNP